MASGEQVYNPTTTQGDKPNKKFVVPTEHLDKFRFFIKCAEVILSFVAFILEEVVTNCNSCGPLYFFEFVSCTAFLFTALLLILLATPLYLKVGIKKWSVLDFVYTAVMAVLFLLASVIFAAANEGTGLEKGSVAFGFLASLAFVFDLGVFFKTRGLPWTSGPRGAGDTQTTQPEAEKLNTGDPSSANGTNAAN
ncbi:CKLF-like MARVEL transmembrane domain-containing protein 6 [Lepisosteus oculatus]|uniref:CKLF-like MARVEL transmembrane domain-containing protein 6 n=1 Tax=Lepisosteus oculatus TaxID=7918 RepID=UPI0035F51E54